jgi:hypothetical protein
MKIETGVMVVKDGKGWGSLYGVHVSNHRGWMNLEDAEIYDPKYCKQPTDVTYKKSDYFEELKTGKLAKGKLAKVERRTEVIFKE